MFLFSYYRRIISQNRLWLKVAILAIFFGFLFGFISPILGLSPSVLIDAMNKNLQNISDQLTSKGTVERILIIWENNLQVTTLMVLLGFFLGFFPFFSLYINGFLIGYTVYLGTIVDHQPWLLALGILPHGIIEIPTVILAASFGMRLGLQWLLPKARGKRKRMLNEALLDCMAILALSYILLLFAAVIEGGLVYNLFI
jgi:stage II sporulation protein M